MPLAQDETLPGGTQSRWEKFAQDCGKGVVQPPMPAVADGFVLFDDTEDFKAGRMAGWRPSHFVSDIASNPISVEQDYPMPGLFLATSASPYRSNQIGRIVQTYKGLSARQPKELLHGIISFSAFIAIQGGGPGGYAWDTFGMVLDVQNWDNTLRTTPTLYVANPGTGAPAQCRIIGSDGTFRNITGLTNPVGGDTVNSTKGLIGGENENKWDINYIRMSYDLGNLFSVTSGFNGNYYEMNLNGHRFDLRTQGHGGGDFQSPQTGTSIFSFAGGFNFGLSLARANTAGALRPARMIVGGTRATLHTEGWLA